MGTSGPRSIQSRLLYHYLKFKLSRSDPGDSLAEGRRRLEAMSTRLPMPRDVDIQPLTVGGRPAEWLRPRGGESHRAVLYLHGGAYTAGSLGSHRSLAARIALACACPVLLLDYRLAPEHPFPAGLDDAVAAFSWLCSPAVGLEARRVALVGDSAGGGLSLALAVRLRDEGHPLPGAVVGLSPWTDLELAGESVTSRAAVDPFFSSTRRLRNSAVAYAGTTSLRHPYVSPVHADLRGLPPLYLQVGEHEILLSDAETVTRRAQAVDTEATLEVWPGLWHVWHALAAHLPEARRAIEKVGAFVKARAS
ncbi:alpha/beta hydrolase [Pyxidicoccus fallax]|uniref:Alpha/beta hydrolase n=1 Tax=Pyxidicoccus fallax TaxID=394095 RepID=A0A848LSA6_9BACT|nr:alpha/beta hydrolase [Pyxidicoccus fallax]NMO20510.1 alpha/beta hydrolase [Pyxidicoccus fallax]NPC85512.1 alpha/beta hydrolase [Pyxidicoccus fallax]